MEEEAVSEIQKDHFEEAIKFAHRSVSNNNIRDVFSNSATYLRLWPKFQVHNCGSKMYISYSIEPQIRHFA